MAEYSRWDLPLEKWMPSEKLWSGHYCFWGGINSRCAGREWTLEEKRHCSPTAGIHGDTPRSLVKNICIWKRYVQNRSLHHCNAKGGCMEHACWKMGFLSWHWQRTFSKYWLENAAITRCPSRSEADCRANQSDQYSHNPLYIEGGWWYVFQKASVEPRLAA